MVDTIGPYSTPAGDGGGPKPGPGRTGPGAPPAERASRSTMRKGHRATRVIWACGILLLAVGGTGLAVAQYGDEDLDTVYAVELDELRGDLSGADAKAANLRARTAAVAVAASQYVDLFDELTAAREAAVDGFNRAIDQYNESGSVDIAQNELQPLIDRYLAAVAALEANQANLAATVTELDDAAPRSAELLEDAPPEEALP